jgi:hypothetical protein
MLLRAAIYIYIYIYIYMVMFNLMFLQDKGFNLYVSYWLSIIPSNATSAVIHFSSRLIVLASLSYLQEIVSSVKLGLFKIMLYINFSTKFIDFIIWIRITNWWQWSVSTRQISLRNKLISNDNIFLELVRKNVISSERLTLCSAWVRNLGFHS